MYGQYDQYEGPREGHHKSLSRQSRGDHGAISAMDCLNDMGITEIKNELTDLSISERTVTIDTDKTGNYTFIDDAGVNYNLGVDQTWTDHDFWFLAGSSGMQDGSPDRTLSDGTIPGQNENWKLYGQIMSVKYDK